MPAFVCLSCGVQYADDDSPPQVCAICTDERQLVGADDPRWTTVEEIRSSHRNVLTQLEPDLVRIDTEPSFAIGQCAYLIRTPDGNVMWDCISNVDDETIRSLDALGGIDAIAISHPHFYASCVEWSHAFDNAPIFIPSVDCEYMVRPSPAVIYFDEDERELVPGVQLVRVGGHFHGSTILVWAAGAEGRGAMFGGDSVCVTADLAHVSFMYSFPGKIPLPADTVRDIASRTLRHTFDRIYGAWSGEVIEHGAAEAVRASADRYVGMVEGTWARR
jgi:glyoxylase-like metal-dependent hydrolase (beta-lactamase superfamily II)